MLSPEDKALISDVGVASGVDLGGSQGLVRTRVVSFKVKGTGPYVVTIPLTQYNQEAVDAAMLKEIQTLRGIGAI